MNIKSGNIKIIHNMIDFTTAVQITSVDPLSHHLCKNSVAISQTLFLQSPPNVHWEEFHYTLKSGLRKLALFGSFQVTVFIHGSCPWNSFCMVQVPGYLVTEGSILVLPEESGSVGRVLQQSPCPTDWPLQDNHFPKTHCKVLFVRNKNTKRQPTALIKHLQHWDMEEVNSN